MIRFSLSKDSVRSSQVPHHEISEDVHKNDINISFNERIHTRGVEWKHRLGLSGLEGPELKKVFVERSKTNLVQRISQCDEKIKNLEFKKQQLAKKFEDKKEHFSKDIKDLERFKHEKLAPFDERIAKVEEEKRQLEKEQEKKESHNERLEDHLHTEIESKISDIKTDYSFDHHSKERDKVAAEITRVKGLLVQHEKTFDDLLAVSEQLGMSKSFLGKFKMFKKFEDVLGDPVKKEGEPDPTPEVKNRRSKAKNTIIAKRDTDYMTVQNVIKENELALARQNHELETLKKNLDQMMNAKKKLDAVLIEPAHRIQQMEQRRRALGLEKRPDKDYIKTDPFEKPADFEAEMANLRKKAEDLLKDDGARSMKNAEVWFGKDTVDQCASGGIDSIKDKRVFANGFKKRKKEMYKVGHMLEITIGRIDRTLAKKDIDEDFRKALEDAKSKEVFEEIVDETTREKSIAKKSSDGDLITFRKELDADVAGPKESELDEASKDWGKMKELVFKFTSIEPLKEKVEDNPENTKKDVENLESEDKNKYSIDEIIESMKVADREMVNIKNIPDTPSAHDIFKKRKFSGPNLKEVVDIILKTDKVEEQIQATFKFLEALDTYKELSNYAKLDRQKIEKDFISSIESKIEGLGDNKSKIKNIIELGVLISNNSPIKLHQLFEKFGYMGESIAKDIPHALRSAIESDKVDEKDVSSLLDYAYGFVKDNPKSLISFAISLDIAQFKDEADICMNQISNPHDNTEDSLIEALDLIIKTKEDNAKASHQATIPFDKYIGVIKDNLISLVRKDNVSVIKFAEKISTGSLREQFALDFYEEARKLSFGFPEKLVDVAVSLNKSGFKEQALHVYKEAVETANKDKEKITEIADRMIEEGFMDEGDKILKEIEDEEKEERDIEARESKIDDSGGVESAPSDGSIDLLARSNRLMASSQRTNTRKAQAQSAKKKKKGAGFFATLFGNFFGGNKNKES